MKGSPIDKPVEVSATEEPMEEVVEKETAAEAKDTEEIDLYDIPATTSD